MPLLLIVAILMVVLFGVSGVWTIAGAVFVLGVGGVVVVGTVQAVDGAWPRTWWPRQCCSQCEQRGHAVSACHVEGSGVSPPGRATFDRHRPAPKTGTLP